MIKNLWKSVQFFCLNHENPIPLTIMEGDSSFYACPHYMKNDEKHPDGYKDGELMCVNRISFTRATSIIEKFEKIMSDDGMSALTSDYTGLTFSLNGVHVRVLKYTPSDIRIGILNRRAVH